MCDDDIYWYSSHAGKHWPTIAICMQPPLHLSHMQYSNIQALMQSFIPAILVYWELKDHLNHAEDSL